MSIDLDSVMESAENVRAIYLAYVAAGFTEPQAMMLLIALASTLGNK